jgi:hypothetical protein
MSKSKTRRRRGGDRGAERKRGGVMLGMRSGFKGITHAVAGEETTGSSKWVGRIITLLLLAAAVGLLLSRL